MTSSPTAASSADPSGLQRPTRSTAYIALIGATSLTILLQGLWAGLFVREAGGYDQSWVTVHARGADVAIVLAALAAVVAFRRLRHRRVLWIGAGVLAVLLILEAYLGGLISESNPAWTDVHIPLASTLMGLSVYLPVRAFRG